MTETQHIAKVAREYLASQEKVRNDLRSMVTRVIVRQQKVELQLSKRLSCKLSLLLNKVTRSPTLCLHQKTSSSSKRMRNSGGVEEKFGSYSPTPNKTEHAPCPLWSELSLEHMTGWTGF